MCIISDLFLTLLINSFHKSLEIRLTIMSPICGTKFTLVIYHCHLFCILIVAGNVKFSKDKHPSPSRPLMK